MKQLKVTILGAGRMGQGLALSLLRTGASVALVGRRPHPVVPPLTLYGGARADAVGEAEILCLAVPDDGISGLAGELALEGSVRSDSAVLHLSGLLDRTALLPLQGSGAGLGSFHPLQAIADPTDAPTRFAGAYAGIEGDARALVAAARLATSMGMLPVRLSGAAKAAYHAGAVMAANYTVALAGVAERLALGAGVPPDIAARIYLPLVRGAAANLERGPAAALTGPILRGDTRTIAAHLAALQGDDRELYRRLGLEALRLARAAGLDPGTAGRIAALLEAGG